MGTYEFFATKTENQRTLLRRLEDYAGRIGLLGAALALAGCSCDSIVSEAPSAPPEALSVQCACHIEGTTPSGVVKNQIDIDPVVCVPDAYRANPGSYCNSPELESFFETAALGALENQLATSCTFARMNVTCDPLRGAEAGEPASSCEGSCEPVLCNATNCSEYDLWNGSCECTQGSACGTSGGSPVCTPSFEGTIVPDPGEPLTLGHGGGARRALFTMAGGWLPESEVATAIDFETCLSGSLCTHVSDEATSEVSGTFELVGFPCPFGSCGLGLHTSARVADFSLDLDVPHHFTNVRIEAFAEHGSLTVNSSGFGYILPGKLTMSARFLDNGVAKVIEPQLNEFAVLFSINWTEKTINLPSMGIGFPGGEGTVTIDLSGTFGSSFAESFDPSLYYEELTDADGDGVGDELDNCPLTANPNQEEVKSPVLVLGSASAGCGSSEIQPPTAEDICFGGPVTVTSSVPSPLPPGTVTVVWTATDARGKTATAEQTIQNTPALVGSNSVSLADRAKVNSGAIVSLGSNTARVGTDALVTTILSKGPIEVRDRSRVTGELVSQRSIRLGSRVSVPAGAVRQYTSPALGSFPELNVENFNVGNTNVRLEPGRSQTLSPGRFSSINVASRATLTLGAGDYFMNSLTLEPDSRLILRGATRLFIRSSLIMRGNVQGNAPFTLVYNGTNEVTFERNFTGQVRAPRARINLGSGNQLTFAGSIMAKDIELRPGASLTCQ